MPSANENVEDYSIEKVFYSINTRLSFIKIGIAKYGKYYRGTEYECNPDAVIFDIQLHVHKFNRAHVIAEIVDILELIHRIQVSIDELPQDEERDTSHEWYVPIDNTIKFKEELNIYKVSLESLKNELDLRLNSTALYIHEIENKIPIQITIPQFSMLLSLFCNEDNNTGIKKIFDSELSKLCKSITTIFKQHDGKVISEKALADKKNSDKYKIIVLKFWSERFKAYQIHCANLISEEDSKNKKKRL